MVQKEKILESLFWASQKFIGLELDTHYGTKSPITFL